ncbi:MAG: hypothetical protein WD689_05800 [Gaiellaceae bacterium]
MSKLFALTLLALALPAAAAAGGWATAGISGDPPSGLGPGDTWNAEITLLQHGQTPLTGMHPTITIRGPETKTFEATPTGTPGVYVAEVVFPTAGSYRYEIDDDFSQVHTFGPVEIVGGAGAGADGDGFPVWGIAPIALAALGLAGLMALTLRRRAPVATS